MDALTPKKLRFSTKAVSEAFFSWDRPLNKKILTSLIKFIEFWTSQNYITLSVHRNDILSIFPHKKMLTENYVVKDASHTKNITNWLRFCSHILDIDNFRSHVPRSTTTHKQIIRLVRYSRQSKVYYDRLLCKNNVIRLQISMNHVLSSHFSQSSQDSLENELPLTDSILG